MRAGRSVRARAGRALRPGAVQSAVPARRAARRPRSRLALERRRRALRGRSARAPEARRGGARCCCRPSVIAATVPRAVAGARLHELVGAGRATLRQRAAGGLQGRAPRRGSAPRERARHAPRSCSTTRRRCSSRCRWRCWRSARSSIRSATRSSSSTAASRRTRRAPCCAQHLREALCLGVTVLTGAPISDALRISRAAKRARPDLPVVWGGWHPSMFARECLDEPSVDVTVRGQGEETFAEIVRRLAAGPLPRGLRRVHGAPARMGRIQENPARPLAPVDKFRAHDYGLIPVERYFELKGKRQLDYISSQGCNFRCAFCSDPFVYGRKWVGLEPDAHGAAAEGAVGPLPLRRRQLPGRDLLHQARARAGARRAASSSPGMKITWAATMRADQGVRLPDEVWARCKQSGLRRLLVGVESGSNEMLKRIRKDIKIEQVFETAAQMLKLRDRRALSLHRRLSRRKRRQHPGDPRLRQAAARDESRLPDADLLLQALSRAASWCIEAVARGFRLPETLEAWAQVRLRGRRARALGVAARSSSSSSASSSSTSSPGSACSRGKRLLQQLARLTAAAATTTAGRSRCCSRAGWCPRRGCHERAHAASCSINPTITGRRHARFPLAVLSLAAALEGRYASHASSTATSTATSSRPRVRAVAGGALRRRRGHRHGRAAAALGDRGLQGDPRRRIRRCRSSGAAPFRPSVRRRRSTPPYVDYAVRGQGEETLARAARCARRSGDADALGAIAGLSWRRDGADRAQQGAAFSAAQPRSSALPYERLAQPAAVPDAHLPRAAHRRLPGGARLPLPLHVLRRGGDVSRQDGAAAGRAPRAGPATSSARGSASDAHPVLRPQLLRPRSRHGAAARGAGEARSCPGGASRARTRW